jgi:hypothetical protein
MGTTMRKKLQPCEGAPWWGSYGRRVFKLPSRSRGGIAIPSELSDIGGTESFSAPEVQRRDLQQESIQRDAPRSCVSVRSMRIYGRDAHQFSGAQRQRLTIGIDPSSWWVPRRLVELTVHVLLGTGVSRPNGSIISPYTGL